MKELLSSLETEYGFAAWDNKGSRISPHRIIRPFTKILEAEQQWLPALESGWFLGNGARLYWDSGGHPEYATPECAGHPKLLVAHVRAGHRILARIVAQLLKSRRIGRIRVWRGNVDYLSAASWGSHENYLVQKKAIDLASDLIPHLVSRVIYGGAGGFSPGDHGRFSLSPRLELFRARETRDTLDERGLINTRSEHHTHNHRRLHLICRDTLVSQTAELLSIGMTRLVVALADMGLFPATELQFDDDLDALRQVCSDPTCRGKIRTNAGRLSAIDIQRRYLEMIDRHRDDLPAWACEITGRCDEILKNLAEDPETLCGVLDWPTKRAMFRSVGSASTESLLVQDQLLTDLDSPLDQYFTRREGNDRSIVSTDDIELAVQTPPSMTRARIRGEVTSRLSGSRDVGCDWSKILTPDRMLLLDEPFESRERWQDLIPPRQPDTI